MRLTAQPAYAPRHPCRERNVRVLGARQVSSKRCDEFLHPFVFRFERVLAENGPLGLIVQLQMDPVHGEIALTLLGLADEITPKFGPRGLRRNVDRFVDGLIGAHALHEPLLLHPVELCGGSVVGDLPLAGEVLGATRARTRTHTSIVAIVRGADVIPSPTPDTPLAAGDTIVAVGTRLGLDALARVLTDG